MATDHDDILRGLDAAARRVRLAEGFAAHDRADAADLRGLYEREVAARHADATALRNALRWLADTRRDNAALREQPREMSIRAANAEQDASDMAALVDVLTATEGEGNG